MLAISSGNFGSLERDAAEGRTKLQPLIELATARPDEFVLGPPVSSGDERLISPVLITLANVQTPIILVGKLEHATLQAALRGASTPSGFYLTSKGKFMELPEIRPIIEGRSGEPFLGGDRDPLVGGMEATLLFGLFMAGLIRRNRVINERVDEATAALRLGAEEQAAMLRSLDAKNAEQARAHELVRRAFGRYVSEEVAESVLRTPEALDARRSGARGDDPDVRPSRVHRHGRADATARGDRGPQSLPRHDGGRHRPVRWHHRRDYRRRDPRHLWCPGCL